MDEELISLETKLLAIARKVIEAPCTSLTQSLLQRILREKHNLHIEVCTRDHVEKPIYYYNIFGKYKDLSLIVCIHNGPHEKYETYELALEDALQAALKLIKEKDE